MRPYQRYYHRPDATREVLWVGDNPVQFVLVETPQVECVEKVYYPKLNCYFMRGTPKGDAAEVRGGRVQGSTRFSAWIPAEGRPYVIDATVAATFDLEVAFDEEGPGVYGIQRVDPAERSISYWVSFVRDASPEELLGAEITRRCDPGAFNEFIGTPY